MNASEDRLRFPFWFLATRWYDFIEIRNLKIDFFENFLICFSFLAKQVELFYSRQFQDREEGLARLTSILKGEAFDYSIGVNKIARSATLLLHRAVRDAVFSVFNHAAETVRALFLDYITGRVAPNEVSRCVDRLLPELLAKSGDPSPRIHTLAQHTILCIAACPEVRLAPSNSV